MLVSAAVSMNAKVMAPTSASPIAPTAPLRTRVSQVARAKPTATAPPSRSPRPSETSPTATAARVPAMNSNRRQVSSGRIAPRYSHQPW